MSDIITSLKNPSDEEVRAVDAWWRANNYLTVGQIYLKSNPLLREPLEASDIKPRLLGHWGTSPGLSLIYAHASHLIQKTGQEMIYITGPGHGGPAIVAATYLENTYTESFPHVTQDTPGLETLFRQFSAPGGIPSHASVTTPGSINEGGELGYALVHAFGAVFDNPDLIALSVVGDGEAETGPLEGSWKSISFLNPARDGAVLPVLHLNGAKIASPTVQGRKDPEEVRKLYEGHGYEVLEVEGDDLPGMHYRFAETLGTAYERIKEIQDDARTNGVVAGERPRWPMIILRSPKGWTGPDVVDGVQVAGTWRSHQVPLSGVRENPDHLKILEDWMKSYRPEELFDESGMPTDIVRSINPEGDLRMSAHPAGNGGGEYRALDMPNWRDFTIDFAPAERGTFRAESTRKLGEFLEEIYRRNPETFRLFCPDETNSNRLGAVFNASDRMTMEAVTDDDEKLSPDGRVMEVLSEHLTHGWLEGYNLTGRHGLFASYEAFGMVSVSQTVQHTKWLEEAIELDWRVPVPSFNILLSSTCWRNDHNGFSHQGPGVLSTIVNMRGNIVRTYLPPDANCLLEVSAYTHDTKNRVNVIVQDKQPQLQWLTPDEAEAHCRKGFGIWDWAGNEDPESGEDPDIVIACAGDVVTMEAVAAAQILRQQLPSLKVRVVNVVRLQTLSRPKDHPTGMTDQDFAEMFTNTQDVLFCFHGYAGVIHQLVHGRPDVDRFHVRGFREEGTTTTPFDMVVRNGIDRYSLVIDALNNTKRTVRGAADLKRWCTKQLDRHHEYKVEHLEDMPEITDWVFEA
ncbi:phosphoketolase family protein [Flaviflexus sp.]|uniref:phosphoketolase family protein n=1 Tax=Flaviflexus sp. TaxID=1969482 RepID=UPI003F8E2DD8